MELNKKGF